MTLKQLYQDRLKHTPGGKPHNQQSHGRGGGGGLLGSRGGDAIRSRLNGITRGKKLNAAQQKKADSVRTFLKRGRAAWDAGRKNTGSELIEQADTLLRELEDML